MLDQRAPSREMLQGDTITRHIAVNPAFLRGAPALAGLLQGRLWNGLTRYVAGHDQAPMTYVQSVITHTRLGPRDPQTLLHADTFLPPDESVDLVARALMCGYLAAADMVRST